MVFWSRPLWALKKAPFLAQDARRHRQDVSYRDRHGQLSGYGRAVAVVGFSRLGRQAVDLLGRLETGEPLPADWPLYDLPNVVLTRMWRAR
ncbi:hypothetical protein GCM10027038_24750 [Arthrobacter bambusae]